MSLDNDPAEQLFASQAIMRQVASELQHLAAAFSETGNQKVEEKLNVLADQLDLGLYLSREAAATFKKSKAAHE